MEFYCTLSCDDSFRKPLFRRQLTDAFNWIVFLCRCSPRSLLSCALVAPLVFMSLCDSYSSYTTHTFCLYKLCTTFSELVIEASNLLKLYTLKILIKIFYVVLEPTYSSNTNIHVYFTFKMSNIHLSFTYNNCLKGTRLKTTVIYCKTKPCLQDAKCNKTYFTFSILK
jgi:hypothetical protein